MANGARKFTRAYKYELTHSGWVGRWTVAVLAERALAERCSPSSLAAFIIMMATGSVNNHRNNRGPNSSLHAAHARARAPDGRPPPTPPPKLTIQRAEILPSRAGRYNLLRYSGICARHSAPASRRRFCDRATRGRAAAGG